MSAERLLRLDADGQEVRVVLPDVEDLLDLLAAVVCRQYPVPRDSSGRDDDEDPLCFHRVMNVASGQGALAGPPEQLPRLVVPPADVKPDVSIRMVLPVGEALDAFDVHVSVVVLDEIRLLSQRTPVGGNQLPVEPEVLPQPHDERDPVLEQQAKVLAVIVSSVHDGELRVHPQLPQLLDRPGQGRHVDHVSGTVAEIDGEARRLVDDVYETHLAADFPVVAADGGEREVDAVRQSRAVDEDVAQLLLLRAKQGKVFAEELALGVFVPDGGQEIADALAAKVGIREQDAGVASLPPAGRVAVRGRAQDVVEEHCLQRVGIPVADGLGRRHDPAAVKELLHDEHVAEVQEQLLVAAAAGEARHELRRSRPELSRGRVEGEHASLAAAEDAALRVEHPADVPALLPDLAAYAHRPDVPCVLHSILAVDDQEHSSPPRWCS